jgi:hypothetical protein
MAIYGCGQRKLQLKRRISPVVPENREKLLRQPVLVPDFPGPLIPL